jgi:hypothetical protein
MAVLANTLDHLLVNVLATASEYQAAETALGLAQERGTWDDEARTAKRKAAELAIAIDGLSDRASRESVISIDTVRSAVSALCFWPDGGGLRPEAFERMNGVANAYKHMYLDKPTHVIQSFDDVLTVGAGYGVDGYGVGKYGGVEVLVRDKSGTIWKFLGDAPVVISAWFSYLRSNGATLPSVPIYAFGIQVHP